MNTETLVKKAQYGDKDAFVELMRCYKKVMYHTALAILHNDDDVADAIQDTYLSVYRNIHKLKKPSYFKTWLTRILINKSYDIINKRFEYTELGLVSEKGDYDRNIEEFSENLLQKIGENYALVLKLFYVCGFTVKEIAKMLNLNENTVKTRIARGREKIRREYETEYDNGKVTVNE